jgi:hypothetical protein
LPVTLPETTVRDLEPEVLDLPARVDVRLINGAGRLVSLPLNQRSAGFTVSARWHDVAAPKGFWQARTVEVSVISHNERPEGAGIQIGVSLDGPAQRFMVPAIFYGVNRVPEGRARYPHFSKDLDAGDALTADHWAFRADRASHPLVIGWSETECVALATDDRSVLGPSGLGFHGNASGAGLLLNFPAREEPVTYVGRDAPAPPEVVLHRWQAGEIATVSFQVFVGGPEPQQYGALLRRVYAEAQDRHSLQPWMSTEAAAALSAHGLYRWHYQPDAGALAETVTFGGTAQVDAGCRDGGAAAYALLTYGRDQENWAYAEAAVAVLDTIASEVAANRAGAEATLFLTRALAFDEALDHEHPFWKEAVVSALTDAVSVGQDEAGAGDLLWIPALLEGAAYLDGVDVVAAAELAAERYGAVAGDAFIGESDDVGLAPSSREAAGAVMAYVALFEATGAPEWLRLARRAADWMMTFRFAYNVDFPAHTILETYEFRSRGADVVSPRDQHLSAHALICLPEMIRLARHSGDDYYLERTRDNLACFLQFIAREDGDFNARKGMVSGELYNTRGPEPRGAIASVSACRNAGLVLYACQAGLSVEP